MHKPYSRIRNGDTCILFVHGIQGSPDLFTDFIAGLPENVDIVNLLLPGHGADVRAFAGSGMAQWQAHVNEAAARLRGQYRRVIYVGHSMGCLLGVDAQLQGAGFAGMLLLACPLAIHPRLRYLRNALKSLRPGNEGDPFVGASRRNNSVQAAHPLQYLLGVGPYIGLLRKMYGVRRRIGGLKLPVCAILSEKDEIVSLRSERWLRKCEGIRIRYAEGCGHYMFTLAAQQKITAEIRALL